MLPFRSHASADAGERRPFQGPSLYMCCTLTVYVLYLKSALFKGSPYMCSSLTERGEGGLYKGPSKCMCCTLILYVLYLNRPPQGHILYILNILLMLSAEVGKREPLHRGMIYAYVCMYVCTYTYIYIYIYIYMYVYR